MNIERIINALRKVWQTLVSELPEVATTMTRLSTMVEGAVDGLGNLATNTSQPVPPTAPTSDEKTTIPVTHKVQE